MKSAIVFDIDGVLCFGNEAELTDGQPNWSDEAVAAMSWLIDQVEPDWLICCSSWRTRQIDLVQACRLRGLHISNLLTTPVGQPMVRPGQHLRITRGVEVKACFDQLQGKPKRFRPGLDFACLILDDHHDGYLIEQGPCLLPMAGLFSMQLAKQAVTLIEQQRCKQ